MLKNNCCKSDINIHSLLLQNATNDQQRATQYIQTILTQNNTHPAPKVVSSTPQQWAEGPVCVGWCVLCAARPAGGGRGR